MRHLPHNTNTATMSDKLVISHIPLHFIACAAADHAIFNTIPLSVVLTIQMRPLYVVRVPIKTVSAVMTVGDLRKSEKVEIGQLNS